jgi:Histidine kinase-, DNA gyrase B-, and HSP90-like ATPase
MPKDVVTYLRLKHWLTSLQSEIDSSWAVLGEIFARQSRGMSKLGLRVRRIYSNLDEPSEFIEGVTYLPEHVRFTTADADLLKLLVGPLYGDRPAIGIRELVQNAVDAVHELNVLRENGVVPTNLDLSEQAAEVTVSVEQQADETWWLTVSDRGIGMTPDIIRNYFLRAGASFRKSEAWQRYFTDEQNHATVLRTGRFGVGALTAFLLGSEIRVSTRHVMTPRNQSLEFHATLDTDPIPVSITGRPIGTTIRVKLDAAVAKNLLRMHRDWDWYCLQSPEVLRTVSGTRLDQTHLLPGSREALPPEWKRVDVAGYEDVQWSYSAAPFLTCNGIVIAEGPTEEVAGEFQHLPLRIPNISIFDRDGLLPLTLRRDGLRTFRYPFERELSIEVAKDYITAAALFSPKSALYVGEGLEWYSGRWHPGYSSGRASPDFGLWGSTRAGILPLEPDILWDRNFSTVVPLPILAAGEYQSELIFIKPELGRPATSCLFVPQFKSVTSEASHLIERYFKNRFKYGFERETWALLFSHMPRLLHALTTDPDSKQSAHRGWHAIRSAYNIGAIEVAVHQDEGQYFSSWLGEQRVDIRPTKTIKGLHHVFTFNAPGEFTISKPLSNMLKHHLAKSPIIALQLQRRPLRPASTEFSKLWRRWLGTQIIPYEQEKITTLLRRAVSLSIYLEARMQDGWSDPLGSAASSSARVF